MIVPRGAASAASSRARTLGILPGYRAMQQTIARKFEPTRTPTEYKGEAVSGNRPGVPFPAVFGVDEVFAVF